MHQHPLNLILPFPLHSITILITSYISYVDKASWWSSYRTSFSITASQAGCSRWNHRKIADCQVAGTPPSKRSQPVLYQTVSLISFHQMRLPRWDLPFSMLNLWILIGGLGAANHGKTSVDKHLRITVGFGLRTNETLTSSRQGAVY